MVTHSCFELSMKKKPLRTHKTSATRRASFPPISDEMKKWSAMLQSELSTLPDISTKSMFGFLSFYRKGKIFAALPRTRGFSSSSSLIFKFKPMPPALLKRAQTDSRTHTNTRIPGQGWFSFELSSEADLRDALFWLNHAYDAAAK
jgi:hypothetical protein